MYATSLETRLGSGTLDAERTPRQANKSAKSTYSPLAADCAVFSVIFGAKLPAVGGVACLVSGAVVCKVDSACVSLEYWFCVVLELYVVHLG